MTAEHFIPGKDAPLETTIARLREKLAALDFHVEERSWLNPLAGIWSVHVRDRDCPLLFTNGKGGSKPAALASALGEFCERLACNYFWAHYYLGEQNAVAEFVHYPQERWFPLPGDGRWPKGLLTAKLRKFYNPAGGVEAGMLVERNSGNAERGICALPLVRLNDGKSVWFPVNLLNNLYVSNGMAAGNTPAEARAQALAEIVERHVKFRVFSENLCLPDVPVAVLARFPELAADIAALRAAGFGILVRDASLGGQYPVLCASLLNPRDQGCYCSFGAHPRFEIALERALTELLQGRALDGLDGFPAPSFEADEVASAPNLEIHFVDSSGVVGWRFLGEAPDFAFCDWNFASTTEEDYRWLVEAVRAQGFDIYLADYAHLGVYVCRIVVPGMSEIYPVDDLEYENDSVANAVRPAILDLAALDGPACAGLLAALNDMGVSDERPVAALIGLAPDAGSVWEDLRVGELKTRLALVAGDEAAIREGCDWIRHFAQIDADRRKVYACLETLLELRECGGEASYRRALIGLYGSARLEQAQALLAGDRSHFGLPSPGMQLAACATHRQLLAAYDKVRRAHRSPAGGA